MIPQNRICIVTGANSGLGLTNLLLPLLKKAPEGSIVNASSDSHHFGDIDVESRTNRHNHHLLNPKNKQRAATLWEASKHLCPFWM